MFDIDADDLCGGVKSSPQKTYPGVIITTNNRSAMLLYFTEPSAFVGVVLNLAGFLAWKRCRRPPPPPRQELAKCS